MKKDPASRSRAATALAAVAVFLVLQGCRCKLVRNLVVAGHMPHEPIYAQSGDDCVEVSPDKAKANEFYIDADCEQRVPYRPTSFKAFCKDNVLGDDRTKVGNPKKWRSEEIDPNPVDPEHPETLWTLSHGSQLKIASLDQTKFAERPYVKRVQYRNDGSCALEMRIYKKGIRDKKLKPAIFIHGGGWTYRGALSIAGIETAAPNLTDRGYIVFAPFYRLLGDSDGPPECHNSVGSRIIEDIEGAFDWVREHGAEYGMDPDLVNEILVVGQSAGSQLAGYLAVHRSKMVQAALLIYPPADLLHLAENLKEGGIYYQQGFDHTERLLLKFVGVDSLAKIDPDSEIVRKTSFPELVDPEPSRLPPLFIIHGDHDDLVPVEQATRFCAARAPDRHPEDGKYSADETKVFDCGAGSELHVIHRANHILDLRCFSGEFTKLVEVLAGEDDTIKLCPAGSEKGARQVRDALKKAYDSLEKPFVAAGGSS